MQAHPFFAGVSWDTMHADPPPYEPKVEHELDTQNFEHFDEDMQSQVGKRRWVIMQLCGKLCVCTC